jgi:hypothetical protein
VPRDPGDRRIRMGHQVIGVHGPGRLLNDVKDASQVVGD